VVDIQFAALLSVPVDDRRRIKSLDRLIYLVCREIAGNIQPGLSDGAVRSGR